MIHIRLTAKCNFNCYFCHIPLLKPEEMDLLSVIKLIYNINHSKPIVFCISGGEPTLVNYLYKVIKFIKKCNPKHHINIETNGFLLSNFDYLNKLVDSGLDSLLLSYHSHIPEIFNKITGLKNSHSFLEKAIENINKTYLDVEISFVINNDNYKDIKGTIEYLNNKLDFKGFLVSNIFEKLNYNSSKNYHLRLEKLGNYLLNSFDLLNSLGKEMSSCGIPMCYLSGYETTYYLGQYDFNRYYKKSEECNNCKLNEYCRGIIGDYGDIYGLGELHKIKKISDKKISSLIILKQDYLNDIDLRINNGII